MGKLRPSKNLYFAVSLGGMRFWGAKDEGKVEGKAGKDSGDAAKADGTEGGDVKVKKEGGEELADDMGTGLDEALGKTKVRGRGRVRARADGGWEGSLTG